MTAGVIEGAQRNDVRWLLLPLVVGFAAMFVPTYWWAAASIWQTDDHGHGPIILVVVLWLFWGAHRPLAALPDAGNPGLGWPVFIFGLMLYALGRAFTVSIFEIGSQMLVVAGALLLVKGLQGLRVAWFAVLFMIFMVPLPGMLVDAATGSLKQWISVIVTEVLYGAGYPIARTGVTITIGQYQLLVADACSGLNSMFSLTALGSLFMYLMARRSLVHNAIMLALILPIAFVANIVRVIVLVLITYHFGDEAGQGFLHGTAGLVLLVASLCILFLVDFLLCRVIPERAVPVAPA